MNFILIVDFLVLSSFIVIRADPIDPTTDLSCNKEGEEKKFVGGYSTCHNGRYVPSACQADDGSKVDIGLTVRQRNFIFECVQTADQANSPLTLRHKACLRVKDNKQQNGLVVEPGQRIRDPPFVFECVRLPSINPTLPQALALKALACANKTSEIPDGGIVVIDDFTYNCSRQSGSLTDYTKEVFLQARGCLHAGKEYMLNSQAIIGDFAYKCQQTQTWPQTLQFSVVGCASEGHRYDENEKFYSKKTEGLTGRYIMQCRRFNDSWSVVPAGCIEEHTPPIDHAIGDTWIDNGGPGDPRLKYVVVCRGDSKSIRVVPIQCVYQPNLNDPASAKTLNPGCFRRFTKPNALVKCQKGANDYQSASVELITAFINKAEQEAIANKFIAC